MFSLLFWGISWNDGNRVIPLNEVCWNSSDGLKRVGLWKGRPSRPVKLDGDVLIAGGSCGLYGTIPWGVFTPLLVRFLSWVISSPFLPWEMPISFLEIFQLPVFGVLDLGDFRTPPNEPRGGIDAGFLLKAESEMGWVWTNRSSSVSVSSGSSHLSPKGLLNELGVKRPVKFISTSENVPRSSIAPGLCIIEPAVTAAPLMFKAFNIPD